MSAQADPSPGSPLSTIAAFDLGSNTIKMTVAGTDPSSGLLNEFLWRSETVRLGLGVDTSGQLAPDRIEAALDVLGRFASEAREAGAIRLLGVATEATRIASNGADFLTRVRDECGIEIQSISGDLEATLTFRGLQGLVDLRGQTVVADIGGGSTEVIIARDEHVEWSRSFPLGSGRLTEQFVKSDPPSPASLAQCREFARSLLDEAPLATAASGTLFVVGGTGEYMNGLIPPGRERTPEVMDDILERLSTTTAEELANTLSIQLARARVLPAGIAIAAAIADRMTPLLFVPAQSGIRRGLLLAAFSGEL